MYLTTAEVAEQAGVKYPTLIAWLHTGKVTCRRWPRRHYAPLQWTKAEAAKVKRLAEAKRVLLRAGWGR